MGRRKLGSALYLAVCVAAALCVPLAVVTAQTRTVATRSGRNDPAAADSSAAARQEFLEAARAQGVSIQADRIAYVNDGKTTIIHAPVAARARSRETDFAAGAPVLFLMIKSTLKLGVPNGAYVVRAQYRLGASTGKALFTDRRGVVAVQRDLLVRTWKQSSDLFPDAYPSPPPAEIPNITSTHVIFGDAHGNPHYYVDCSGVNGTLYFPM